MSIQDRELTQTLKLDDPSKQQFEVRIAPQFKLILKNPFQATLQHPVSITDATQQCNEGNLLILMI